MKLVAVKALLAAAAVNLALSAPASAQEQEIACAANDGRCLQRFSEAACRDRGATRVACEALLHRLEEHPDGDELAWLLARGWVNMFLADFATVSSLPDFGSVSEAEARAYRAEATDIFRDAAARAPDDVEALGSVAVITENSAERIRLLRQIVGIDPGRFAIVELLVSELLLQSDAADVYLDAAGMLEAAYERVDFVPKRWILAGRALDFYERSGNASKRDAFRSKWAEDIHFDTALTEFASVVLLAQKQQLLSTLCDGSVQRAFGSGRCLALIDSAMTQLPAITDGASKLEFSEHIVSIMTMVAHGTAPPPGSEPLNDVYKANVEAIVAMGTESASILNDYATFLLPDEQIPVLERAVALAPENGDVRYRLALIYGNQGRWDKAAEQFRAARAYVDEWKRPYLDQQLERAESQRPVQ